LIEDLLLHEQDPRLVADIIETLHAGDTERMTQILQRFLDHSHHRVRGSAVQTLLRRCDQRPVLTKCLEHLASLLSSTLSVERATAAVVMGATGLPVFVPALGVLADDEQAEVSRHACRSLARIGSSQAVRLLAEKRIMGRHTAAAQSAWELLNREGMEERAKVLARLSAAERSRIGFWLKAVQSSADDELLMRVLRVSESQKRETLLRALGSEDADRDLLANCLCLEGTEIRLDPEPLLERLLLQDLDRFPTWGDLIIPLCGPGHAGYERVLLVMLQRLAREMCIYERGCSVGLWKDEQRKNNLDKWLDNRLRVVIHFTALAGKQPAETLEALVKATTSDRFVHSVALEFLEEQLGRTIAAHLFPLLEPGDPMTRQARLASTAGIDLQELDQAHLEEEVRTWLAEPGF